MEVSLGSLFVRLSPSANTSVSVLTFCYVIPSSSCPGSLLPAGVSSGVPQSFVGIPVWGGKDPHLRGTAQFPTANTQTWEWWELDLLLGFEPFPAPLFSPPTSHSSSFLSSQEDPGQCTSSWPMAKHLAVILSSAPPVSCQTLSHFSMATR